ncbi:MAG: TlpA family protein disulfide reductase [Isosphaeraceae bacterium]
MTTSIVRMWAGAWLVLLVAAGLLPAGAVPRYDLKPGQVLTYESKETFTSKSENSRSKTTWRLWVVGRNDDGSWRIVARTAMATLGEPGSPAQDEMVSFARFDVRPDGEVPACPTLGTHVDPSEVFPRLPGDERQAAAGWESRDERDDTTISYKALAGNDVSGTAAFDFQADRRSYVERIYEGTDHRMFHFDQKRGLIAGVDISQSYGSHMQSAGKGMLELKSVTEMAPALLAAFRDEMGRYFSAELECLALYRKAAKSGDQAGKLMNQARKVLADARAKVTLPEPSAALDAQLKDHDQDAADVVDEAELLAQVIGHPAAAWEIRDFDGRTHTLKQYRGKVLVLDFWYRGCGWCMRAMPQLKRIASHYRGRPVAVFGMNYDQKEEDARFVVKEMQLDYPVLRSQALPAKYGVQTYPTVIIIDQQGKVADIHVGYSPQLFEDVTAAIDRLLEAK